MGAPNPKVYHPYTYWVSKSHLFVFALRENSLPHLDSFLQVMMWKALIVQCSLLLPSLIQLLCSLQRIGISAYPTFSCQCVTQKPPISYPVCIMPMSSFASFYFLHGWNSLHLQVMDETPYYEIVGFIYRVCRKNTENGNPFDLIHSICALG